MKRIMILMIVTLMLAAKVFSAMYANGGNCFFVPTECTKATILEDNYNTLNYYLIQGAKYFFESNSQYYQFLKAYETGNIKDLTLFLLKTYDNLKASKAMYSAFNKQSMEYAYNEPAISQLKIFDYSGYQRDSNLLPSIYDKVKKYLTVGNVRGAFVEIQNLISEISLDLESLLMQGGIPDKWIIWRITQKFNETGLYGQYLAEIFNHIQW